MIYTLGHIYRKVLKKCNTSTDKSFLLTEFISDSDLSRGYRGLTHTCGVAAAHAKAVGFTLCQVKQGKARRLDWHTGVHLLPGICP